MRWYGRDFLWVAGAGKGRLSLQRTPLTVSVAPLHDAARAATKAAAWSDTVRLRLQVKRRHLIGRIARPYALPRPRRQRPFARATGLPRR